MLKRLLLIIVLILLILVSGCTAVAEPPQVEPPKEANVKYITIKYRDTPVNIAASHFEYLNTDVSSFIRGAWYDEGNQYMVINLDGVYYHYCGMLKDEWQGFKQADSFGRYYLQNIKGAYDCREEYVPEY